jgi:hypothetical protein
VNLVNQLELYEIESHAGRTIVAALTPEQAAQIFVTWEASEGRNAEEFSVRELPLDSLSPVHQAQLRAVLSAEKAGIVRHDAENGWTVHWDGWISGDPADEEDQSLLSIFKFGGETITPAYVLARDECRAGELLGIHFREPRANPGALALVETALQDIEEEAANDAVNEALDIGWEGLVTSDEAGFWSFATPLGRR